MMVYVYVRAGGLRRGQACRSILRVINGARAVFVIASSDGESRVEADRITDLGPAANVGCRLNPGVPGASGTPPKPIRVQGGAIGT